MKADTGVVPRSVVLTPRTPRAVVVLPEVVGTADGGIGMRSSFHRSLEWLGRTWGGANMLVVPTVGGTVPSVFERLVRGYDPDVVVQWVPNVVELAGRDLRLARLVRVDTGGAAATKDQRASVDSPNLFTDGTDADFAAEGDADLFADLRMVGPKESDTEACLELAAKVTAFADSTQDSVQGVVSACHLQSPLPVPLTLVEDLLTTVPGFGELAGPTTAPPIFELSASRSVLDVDIEALDPWLNTSLKIRLGVTGVGGRQTPGDRATGEVVASRTFDATNTTFIDEATEFVVRGTVRTLESHSWCSPEAISQAPMTRSRVGLDMYSTDGRGQSPMLIVVGDTVEDAALYLCWTRIYGPHTAAWLPSTVLNEVRGPEVAEPVRPVDLLLEHIKELFTMVPSPLYGSAFITSFGESIEDLELLRRRMNDGRFWLDAINNLVASMVAVSPDGLPVAHHRSVLMALPETVMTSTSVVFRDGVAQAPVRSPIPSLVAAHVGRGASGINWVCDASVDDTPWPAHSAAQIAEVVPPGTPSLAEQGVLRFGRNGTTWVARNSDTLMPGVNVEHGLHAPTLRAVEIGLALHAVIEPGWHWHLSAAGRFYLGFEELAGGLDETLRLLRDPTTRSVLRAFVGRPAKSTGYLLDGRWHLTFAHFVEAQHVDGDDSTATEEATVRVTRAIDLLTSRRILVRGLKLKCQRCSRTAFYRLEALSQVFTCDRCAQTQDLGATSWRDGAGLAEPQWFYALDEVAYEALDHNIEGPAFTLDALGATDPNVHYSWSVQLIPPFNPAAKPTRGKGPEIDFVVLNDSRLIVGEAKTNDHLGKSGKTSDVNKEIGKTMWAAKRLDAHEVVFSTTRPVWAQGTRTALDNYQATNVTVRVLDGLS